MMMMMVMMIMMMMMMMIKTSIICIECYIENILNNPNPKPCFRILMMMVVMMMVIIVDCDESMIQLNNKVRMQFMI